MSPRSEFLHSGPRRHLRRVPYLRHRVKSIRSGDNPQIKALIKLAGSSRERRRTGSTILEGEHLVRAYQESGGIAETILVSESALARPELRSFFESVPAHSRLALSDELDLKGPVAWLFGNEGAGLSEGTRRLATHRVRIPMPGPAESLNVAAAVAICLFEQIRQRSAA